MKTAILISLLAVLAGCATKLPPPETYGRDVLYYTVPESPEVVRVAVRRHFENAGWVFLTEGPGGFVMKKDVTEVFHRMSTTSRKTPVVFTADVSIHKGARGTSIHVLTATYVGGQNSYTSTADSDAAAPLKAAINDVQSRPEPSKP